MAKFARLMGVMLLLLYCTMVLAQEEETAEQKVYFVGSLQHDGLFGLKDEAIGAMSYSSPYLSNSYVDLGLRSKWVSAGVRAEVMEQPLPGFESDFKGSGVSNLFVKGECEWGTLTVGDVYSQFGSGLILRLYEERSLGVDNSLRGGRLTLTPYKGVFAELLGGKQRVYWNCYDGTAWNFDYTKGAVLGGNVELQVDEWSEKMQEVGARLMLGGSYVSKYEPMDTVYYTLMPAMIYNFPRWVGAGDVRGRFDMGGWSVLAEYAYKANDPSTDNEYSYRPGSALLLSGSYSQSGMSALLQIKRSENMAFRSDRLRRGTGAFINHLPAFSNTHTYALAALYPYATQMDGEWAFQTELRYTWKRKTAMGGRYGTTLKLNASHIRGLGEKGWFSMGKESYYTDANVELNKKLSKKWYLNAMYMFQEYNKRVVEGHGDLIRSHILVADVKYQVNDKVGMRAELQYLYSREDEGQWIYGLYELSLFNSLMLGVSDMYNIGGTSASTNLHYYNATASYQIGAHRLQFGFGRTRAGYNCSGGVCRYVPAQKGFNLSYNFTW